VARSQEGLQSRLVLPEKKLADADFAFGACGDIGEAGADGGGIRLFKLELGFGIASGAEKNDAFLEFRIEGFLTLIVRGYASASPGSSSGRPDQREHKQTARQGFGIPQNRPASIPALKYSGTNEIDSGVLS
jgi:hypothetical protein